MRTAPLLLLALLAGCAGPPPSRVQAYVCENGSGFTRFVKAAGPAAPDGESSAVLLLNGKAHVLDRMPAADGALYADDGYEFWSRGRDARLTAKAAATTTACREQ